MGRVSLHEYRPKHRRLMALAESHCERASFHTREASRYGQGTSVDYADAARSHSRKGWESVRRAIACVVECGCDQDGWSEKVRDWIKE